MGQYKYNIKEQGNISELCALCQGSNDIIEKYILRFKKIWQITRIKLDEYEICGIFHESIIPILQLHAPSAKDVGFSTLVQQLV